MRSTGESIKRSDTEEQYRYGNSESNNIKKPSWKIVQANGSNIFLEKINMALNRLSDALEKEIRDVCKNKI